MCSLGVDARRAGFKREARLLYVRVGGHFTSDIQNADKCGEMVAEEGLKCGVCGG